MDIKPPSSTAADKMIARERGRLTSAIAVTARPKLSTDSTMRRSNRSDSRPIGTWNASPPSTANNMKVAIVSRAMALSCIHAGTSE